MGSAQGTGSTSSFTYDGWGRVATSKNPRGYTTTYAYDIADRKISTTSPAVTTWSNDGTTSSTLSPTQSFGYNTFGEQTHFKDEKAAVTATAFDVYGRKTLVTLPTDGATPTEKWTYDANDNALTFVDRLNKTTSYAYDSFNRVRTKTDPIPVAPLTAPITTWTYLDSGDLSQMTAPDSTVTKYGYDDLGRVRTSTVVETKDFATPTDFTITTDYDDLGNVVKTVDPMGKTTTATFDALSRPVLQTDGIGGRTRSTYTPNGWLDTTFVADGSPVERRVKNYYNDIGWLLKREQQSSAGAVLYTESWANHDKNGTPWDHIRPTSATPVTDQVEYDALDRLVTSKYVVQAAPLVQAVTKAGYDVSGNLVRVEDPLSGVAPNGVRAVTMSYNAWGLLKSTVEPSANATGTPEVVANRTWTVTYDAAGNATKEVRPGAVTVNRTFDARGLMLTESGAGSGAASATRTFGYDLVGRMVSQTSGGTAQSYTYNSRGLLKTAPGSVAYTYDGSGLLSKRVDQTGTTDFTYNGRGDMSSYSFGGKQVTLGWRPSGELENINYPTNGMSRAFGYDEIGRLKSDHLKTSTNATMSLREYSYYADSSVSTMQLTESGNTKAGLYKYWYDAGSRLTQTEVPGATTPVTSTFGYDLAGNRTSMTVGGGAPTGVTPGS